MEQHQGLTAEMYRAVVAVVDDRIGEIRVTREDYDRLVQAQERVEGRMERVEAALERLAQAQARTEERVGRLEEGQIALQQGQTALEAALERLAQAQARTEERVGRLEERVGRLEEGQIALQQGQTALEEGQIALQRGQTALEAALERLVQAQARTEVAVGSLAENVGFGLEDVARLMLPPYLDKHYGIQLTGVAGEELQRQFFQVDDQPLVEINLYGEGQRDGQRAVVLGEAKSRIGGGVVKDFADTLRSVEPLVEGEVWRVMFGYYIHPSAQPVAEEHRILLVASYQR